MANQAIQVVQQLRRTVLLQDGAGLTDGQLLGCFIEQRDEAAFAALVKRHGPLVWGVCRRLLSHEDAQDAFQASFLVLARKAAAVVPREMVAHWLYGVAHQTALQARRAVARRGARERRVAEMPEPAAAGPEAWDDLRPLLDQELSRLPDKYRAVLVLCDLGAKTRKEVAQQLGCPEGTVAGRLARARAMLAKRLTRRGVALSGGALAAVLAQEAASAGVPASVLSDTIRAVSPLAAGTAATGTISANVAALAEGVMKAMLLTKLKTVTAVLVLLSLVTLTSAVLAWGQTESQGVGVEEPTARADEQPVRQAPKPKDDGGDNDRLQGSWSLVSVERDGQSQPADRNKGPKVTYAFVGDKLWTQVEGGKNPLPDLKGRLRYRLHTAKMPKEIDVLDEDGKLTLAGIYLLEGGTLRICLAGGGEGRPTEFRTKQGTRNVLMTLEKASDPKKGKEEAEKEGFTAWGQEVGGLQAGLGTRPAGRRAYGLGETVTLVVRVRNVGKGAVKFEYLRQFLDENPPTVTDADGKAIPQRRVAVTGLVHVPVEVTLEPGKEIELASRIQGASGRRYELLPVAGKGKLTTKEWPLFMGTGKISLQYEHVLGDSSSGVIKLDPTLGHLTTGKLELEIKADPPTEKGGGDDAVKKELAKLEGTWVAVGGAFRGTETSEEDARRAGTRLAISGDKFEWYTAIQAEPLMKGTVKIDPTKRPKQMDLSFDRQGESAHGQCLYELDGDTLKLCYGEPDRPTELKMKPGSDEKLYVWQRESK